MERGKDNKWWSVWGYMLGKELGNREKCTLAAKKRAVWPLWEANGLV